MKNKCLWLLLFLFSLSSHAAADYLDLPLNRYVPAKTVDLRCIAGFFTVQIPIPDRWEVKKAVLSVPYVNSSNLIMDQAQLVVEINDYPVGQVKLNPLYPEGKLAITIPPAMMPSGYNKLTFKVAQHFTKDCENPCAPDLWTSLNFDDSFLRLEYSLKPVPLRLSEVGNFLFDPKTFPQGEVNIITENTSSNVVTLAGIAASGISRRFNYRKTVFTASRDIRPGVDNILIGTKEFVEAFLLQKGVGIGKITGPYLKIIYMPEGKAGYNAFSEMAETFLKQKEVELNDKISRFLKTPFAGSEKSKQDPFHALLVVTGANLKHLEIAAETLANMTFPFPGIDETTILEFSLPEISLYSGRRVLQSDKIYKFKTLEFSTHTFEGLQPAPMDIAFRLPADFLIKQNQAVKMSLNFAYGAGMRADSVLNIKLNGKVVRSISVGKTTGDTITGYKLEIPTYLFKAGNNVLTFAPILTPIAKECDLIQLESLFLTIFENSTLYFPPMAHFVELPKIELFMINGFPFTRWPDGYETLIYLTRPDDNVIAAAFNIIGMITQKNGYPLFGVKIGLEKPKKWEGELVVIGDVDSVPDIFKKGAPLKLLKESTVPYPVISNWEGEASFAYSRQITEIGGGSGAMMEFESPFKQGRTVLLFTAGSPRDLLHFSYALLDPGVQSMSEGDLIMVGLTPPDYKVSALKTGKRYFTGKTGTITLIGVYLYTYPILYYIAILILILIVSLTAFYILRRFRRKRRLTETGEEVKKGRFSPWRLLSLVLRKGTEEKEGRPEKGKAETETKSEAKEKAGGWLTRKIWRFVARLSKKKKAEDEKKDDTKNS